MKNQADAIRPEDIKLNELKIETGFYVVIIDRNECQSVLKMLGGFFLRNKGIPTIIDTVKCSEFEDGERNSLTEENLKSLKDMKGVVLSKVNSDFKVGNKRFKLHDEANLTLESALSNIESMGLRYKLAAYIHTISYEHMTYPTVMKLLVDEGITIPTSFETIGSIIHLNLIEDNMKYKYVIGKVLLDKIKAIQTVVCKTGSLNSVFRECPFELLAGEDVYTTFVNENGMKFFVDFKNVYWNSRLSNEREHICSEIPERSIVYDVMGGVGGFGVYLARRKRCKVVSNDLNPAGYDCMLQNIKLNKVSGLMTAVNMDGRDFIRLNTSIERLDTTAKMPRLTTSYFLMNLPSTSLEFLDAYENAHNVIVLSYCFENPEEYAPKIESRVARYLAQGEYYIESIRHVRDVAPNKHMYCVKIVIP